MARYTIRIVLHDADPKDYAALHEAMEARSAKRWILGSDGARYDLPDAEYDLETDFGAVEVRNRVVAIAELIKPDPSVLVTPVLGARQWQLRKAPGQS